MNTVVMRYTQQLVTALAGGITQTPEWDHAKGIAAAVAEQILHHRFSPMDTYEDIYDHLLIAMLQTRIAVRQREHTEGDLSLCDVETTFRSTCPEWLTTVLGFAPGTDIFGTPLDN